MMNFLSSLSVDMRSFNPSQCVLKDAGGHGISKKASDIEVSKWLVSFAFRRVSGFLKDLRTAVKAGFFENQSVTL